MQTQDTIQIRIDRKTKQKAKAMFEEMGLDMSSGIKLFLHNVVLSKGIPLDLRTENGFTLAEEMLLLSDAKKSKKSKRYSDLSELFADLDTE